MNEEIEVQKDEIALCPNAQLGSDGAQVHTLQACRRTTTCSGGSQHPLQLEQQ